MRTAKQVGPARSGKVWLRAVAWSLLGLVLLAVSAALSLPVPERIADEKAFLAARPCGREEAATGTADCMRTIRGTALSAEHAKNGKTAVFRVQLQAPVPAPADQPMDLDSHGELSDLIKPGDEVEVTTWRNIQVAVSHDGVSETLPGLPDEQATMFVGLTLAGVWLAILAFIAALGSTRRARGLATGRPFPNSVRFSLAKCVGVVAAPLAAGFVAGGIWDGWTAVVMTVVIWALIALPATIAALLWNRDRSRTSSPVARLDAEDSRTE
ncbi:hypothetical protein [Streptomyces sp. NBC_00316]|uniref:hypothetical protein n=1 Tax=Streptomyces sp. NBC_00316 TaxID=2975710 RepID=UPI002E295935|nr:hypothetical protein [Streptomyces sp. NBC_00316]